MTTRQRNVRQETKPKSRSQTDEETETKLRTSDDKLKHELQDMSQPFNLIIVRINKGNIYSLPYSPFCINRPSTNNTNTLPSDHLYGNNIRIRIE